MSLDEIAGAVMISIHRKARRVRKEQAAVCILVFIAGVEGVETGREERGKEGGVVLFKTLDLGMDIEGAMEGLNEGGTTRINAPASFIYSNLLTVNKGEFMNSASEAAQSAMISPHVRGVETETFLILSKISEEKDFLKTILEKYNVKNPGAIEKMIEQGKIGEHPAYEDYLSALSYEHNINDLKKLLDNLVKRI